MGSSGKQNLIRNDKPLQSGSVGWKVAPYTKSGGLDSWSERIPGVQFPSPVRMCAGSGGVATD